MAKVRESTRTRTCWKQAPCLACEPSFLHSPLSVCCMAMVNPSGKGRLAWCWDRGRGLLAKLVNRESGRERMCLVG